MDHNRDDEEYQEDGKKENGEAGLGGKISRDEKKPPEKEEELDDDEQPVRPLQLVKPLVQAPDPLLINSLRFFFFDRGLRLPIP